MNMRSLIWLCCGLMLCACTTERARPSAQQLIEHFKMEKIPQEGPWFTLTYRSDIVLPQSALPSRYDGPRAAGNAIVALATREDFSALHRLKTDETWHYYGGDPLQMLILHPDGGGEIVVLGPDVIHGQKVQQVVPAGSWQGAIPLGNETAYTLFGDTLTPGFEYSDFEMGYRSELQLSHPAFTQEIVRLTRKEFITRPR